MVTEVHLQYEIIDMHSDFARWTIIITRYRKNILKIGNINWNTVTKNGVHEQNIIDHQGS